MDNLEYKDIVYYIENDILKTRLINNSRIIETQGGGVMESMFGNTIKAYTISILKNYLPPFFISIIDWSPWIILFLKTLGINIPIFSSITSMFSDSNSNNSKPYIFFGGSSNYNSWKEWLQTFADDNDLFTQFLYLFLNNKLSKEEKDKTYIGQFINFKTDFDKFLLDPTMLSIIVLFGSYLMYNIEDVSNVLFNIKTDNNKEQKKKLLQNSAIFLICYVFIFLIYKSSNKFYSGLYLICMIGLILYIKFERIPTIKDLTKIVVDSYEYVYNMMTGNNNQKTGGFNKFSSEIITNSTNYKHYGGLDYLKTGFNYLKSGSWAFVSLLTKIIGNFGSYIINIITSIINLIRGNKIETIKPPEELIELIESHSEQEQQQELIKVPDLIKEKFVNKFYFNSKTGLIEFNDTNTDINSIITSIADINSLNINHIYMITTKEKITFNLNNETLENDINNLSIIDNKPIHLALVMAYIFSKNDYIKLESYQEKCKTIFGSYTENICAKHIYSVLGKSSISILNNLGQELNLSKLEQNLLNADIEILYEILKNLNWKFKITSKKQHLVDVDEWNRIVNSDYIELYNAYFRQHNNIRILLNNIVNKINNNSDFINKKSGMIKDRNVDGDKNHDKIKPRKKTL